jgi:hypothetical protein
MDILGALVLYGCGKPKPSRMTTITGSPIALSHTFLLIYMAISDHGFRFQAEIPHA